MKTGYIFFFIIALTAAITDYLNSPSPLMDKNPEGPSPIEALIAKDKLGASPHRLPDDSSTPHAAGMTDRPKAGDGLNPIVEPSRHDIEAPILVGERRSASEQIPLLVGMRAQPRIQLGEMIDANNPTDLIHGQTSSKPTTIGEPLSANIMDVFSDETYPTLRIGGKLEVTAIFP